MSILLIISFFLENCFNLLFNNNLIIPLFFLISLIIIYQQFELDEKVYIVILIILGIVYDVVYTDMLYIDSLLFAVIGYLNMLYVKNFNNNHFFNGVFVLISLTIYQLLLYLIFILLGLNHFNIYIILEMLLKSYIINLIYYYVCYIIISKIKDRSSYARITRGRDSKKKSRKIFNK